MGFDVEDDPIYSLQVKGFKDDIAEPSSEVKF